MKGVGFRVGFLNPKHFSCLGDSRTCESLSLRRSLLLHVYINWDPNPKKAQTPRKTEWHDPTGTT